MSIITLSEIRQAARYYAGHRVVHQAIAYAACASLVAGAAIGIPQLIDAHATQIDRVATVHSQIAGQIDSASTIRATLVEQIEAAEKVSEQAGKKSALPEKNSLKQLQQAIADAQAQLAALDEQTTETKKANAAEDSASWFPHIIGAQADDLAGVFNDLRTETVAANATDLSELADTVRAEIAQKAAADKQAAAQAAEEEAAAAAAQAAEAAAQPQYAPQAQQQQTANVGNGGGGSCRAQAEGLVASLSGAGVTWRDVYGASGMTGAGEVILGGGGGVALSSGSADAYWCTESARYVAAHEAAHAVHNANLDRLMDAGYRFDWQLARAESAGDCIAHGWGYTGGATYGCDAEGQELARLILG